MRLSNFIGLITCLIGLVSWFTVGIAQHLTPEDQSVSQDPILPESLVLGPRIVYAESSYPKVDPLNGPESYKNSSDRLLTSNGIRQEVHPDDSDSQVDENDIENSKNTPEMISTFVFNQDTYDVYAYRIEGDRVFKSYIKTNRNPSLKYTVEEVEKLWRSFYEDLSDRWFYVTRGILELASNHWNLMSLGNKMKLLQTYVTTFTEESTSKRFLMQRRFNKYGEVLKNLQKGISSQVGAVFHGTNFSSTHFEHFVPAHHYANRIFEKHLSNYIAITIGQIHKMRLSSRNPRLLSNFRGFDKRDIIARDGIEFVFTTYCTDEHLSVSNENKEAFIRDFLSRCTFKNSDTVQQHFHAVASALCNMRFSRNDQDLIFQNSTIKNSQFFSLTGNETDCQNLGRLDVTSAVPKILVSSINYDISKNVAVILLT